MRQYFTSILLIFFKSNSPDGKAGLFMPSLSQEVECLPVLTVLTSLSGGDAPDK